MDGKSKGHRARRALAGMRARALPKGNGPLDVAEGEGLAGKLYV
jgi:hypothetical protein